MSQFELKVKKGTLEIELKGETNEVLEAYRLISEDLFTNKGSADSGINEEETEISADITESSKVVKNKGKQSSSKKSKKFNFVQLDDNFDEAKFYQKFQSLSLKKQKEQILISAFLYLEQTQQQTFTIDLVHTLLDKVAIDTPKNLSNMVANYVNIDKLLERVNSTEFKFKHVGRTYCTELISKYSSTLDPTI